MRHIRGCSYLLSLALFWPTSASAEDDCMFQTQGSTLHLMGDCTTDATIPIPDGMTLDGDGHRIMAMDPAEGAFQGAVVQAAGAVAHVRRLTVDTEMLENVCGSSPAARLRGIAFEGASGSIVHSKVLNVRKSEGGCQEGHAISVRATEDEPSEVWIVGNHIEGYQKTGVLAVGAVAVTASLNHIVGLGSTDRIAQNGIQLSSGATGHIKLNHVEGNLYAPGTFTSAGILLLGAGDGVEVELNRLESNDVGIFLVSTSAASLRGNKIEDATYDGIAIDGRGGLAADNQVSGNRVDGAANGIDVFGAGATGTTIAGNHIRNCSDAGVQALLQADANVVEKNLVRDCSHGISIDSDDNAVIGNLIKGSSISGLSVTGDGNLVKHNLVW